MSIPFLNLQKQHAGMRRELDQAIGEVLDSGAFAGGPAVAQFETDFAQFCGTDHALGVGSGTEAIWLCLLALGIGAGDEVITVPNTFMATAEAITYCGATPVFVDVDPRTYTLDPTRLESAITSRTKAIIPVHLYGQMADMDPILAVGAQYGIPVIEDACQAHGARYNGRLAGSMGIAGCFSFYPGKNLGALGEAGAITTQDGELHSRLKVFRDHGQPQKYHHTLIGWNARMDGIQAAALSVKLKRLPLWNESRRKIAQVYNAHFQSTPGMTTPIEAEYSRHVYHLYPIQVENRETIRKILESDGIQCGVHYPIPVHLQTAYAGLGLPKGSFPVAEALSNKVLSLPLYPELTRNEVDFIAERTQRALAAV